MWVTDNMNVLLVCRKLAFLESSVIKTAKIRSGKYKSERLIAKSSKTTVN